MACRRTPADAKLPELTLSSDGADLKATRMVEGFIACHAGEMNTVALAKRPAIDERSQVRRALGTDIPKLAAVLARAFDADPFINWCVLQDARRAERFTATFDLILRRMSKDLNETFTTTSLGGCAIWKRPSEHALGFGEQLSLLPAFARVMGWSALPRFSRFLECAQRLHDRLAPLPHYYLFMLGVDPAAQRRGIGSQLLEPVLDRCDQEQRVGYLETARAENVPYYARHGFQVAHVLDEPRFPKLWLMLRLPSAPQEGVAQDSLAGHHRVVASCR